jgi:hypothetical protein
MTQKKAVQTLLASAGQLAECKAARMAWARKAGDRWLAAQLAMDERCGGAVERLSEEEFDRLFEEEQAKVDAIRAEIEAVKEHDLWPRHLYFGGL